MPDKPLNGMTVTLVGAGIYEKLSGGARIGSLIDILRKNGASVNLVSYIIYGKSFKVKHHELPGVHAATLTFPTKWPRILKGLFLLPFIFFYSWRFCRKSRVIWTSCGGMILNMAAVFSSKVVRRPLVYDYLDYEFEIPEPFFKWLLRSSTTVFACSHWLGERARAYGCWDVIYVPCFVNLDLFQFHAEGRKEFRSRWGVGDDDLIVGYAGVLSQKEGVAVLLEALKKVRAKRPNVKLAILGFYVPRSRWRTYTQEPVNVPRLVKELDLEGHVFTNPPVVHKDVPKFLSACDILCSPKLDLIGNRATIAIKLIEYMAMQKPTVSSAVGEVKRIITPEVDGFLAAPGDSDDLARVLDKIAAGYPRALKIAKASRDRVAREFSSHIIGETVVQVLARLSARQKWDPSQAAA